MTDVHPTTAQVSPRHSVQGLWSIRSHGPTLTVEVEADLDVELAYELRDRVLDVVRSRRAQVVILDLAMVRILDPGAGRAVAALLTLLEHRDVEAQLRPPIAPHH